MRILEFWRGSDWLGLACQDPGCPELFVGQVTGVRRVRAQMQGLGEGFGGFKINLETTEFGYIADFGGKMLIVDFRRGSDGRDNPPDAPTCL